MKYAVALIFVLVATIAEAACPAGSTCENYQGQIPYPTTTPSGNSPGRTPSDRANDHGINILEYGAARNNLSSDSSGAIQEAIDTCYNTTGCRNIYCPDGDYALYQSVFFDTPNSLRGGAPWVATTYQVGDIVTQSGTYYRSTIANNGNTPPGTGWVTSPAVLWSNAATYAVNDTVIYNGIMWKSVAGGNTGHTPSNGTAFWKQTVEQGNIRPYWSASFTGSPGQPFGTGCRLFVIFGGFPAMWVFGNGMMIEGITVQNNATGLYRCQNDPAQVGFAMAGGGSSLTTFRNVNVVNFYTGIETSTNGVDNVNDSNLIERSDISGSCRGLSFPGTQNFQNTVIESRVTEARLNVAASQNNGVNIIGGNYTTGNSANNTFTMSGVTFDSSTSQYRLTATLSSNALGTWPDQYLTNAACSGANDATFTASVTAGVLNVPSALTFGTLAVNDYVYNPDHLGMFQIVSFGTGSGGAGTYNLNDASFTSSGPQTWRSTKRSDYPTGCTYDVFVVKTNGFGNIPFHLVNGPMAGLNYVGNNWNNNTNTVTLQMDIPTSGQWNNSWVGAALKADIESQTTLYASEIVNTFWTCGADIRDIHIENAGAATLFMNSVCTFGQRKNSMRNIYINYQPDQVNNATLVPPVYYAQQSMPSIRVSHPLDINGMDVGLADDRSILELSGGAFFSMGNALLPLNIRLNYICSANSFSGGANGTTLPCGNMSTAIGGGQFWGLTGGGSSSASLAQTLADQWRGGTILSGNNLRLTGGMGATNFLGRRPDPTSSSCVTAAFLSNYVGSLPALTTTGAAGFTGALSGNTLTVSGIVGGNNLAANQRIYGNDMTPLTLGSYIAGGTPGGNGTYNVPQVLGNISARPMTTLAINIPYPILYGGQQYKVCDNFTWTRNGTTTNAFYSNHLGYSLGQNYTSTINPALAWSLKRQSPALYMDPASLRLIHPGLVLSLTCNSMTKNVMVLETRAVSGYLLILDADQDNSPYVPDFGQDCVGGVGSATLNIGQAAYSVVQY